MNRELKRQIVDESTLSLQQALELDEALEQQGPVARLVGALSDEQPSLAWRSELNAKLERSAARARRSSLSVKWLSGLAAAAALATCAVFVAPLFTSPQQPEPLVLTEPKTPSVEESLVSAHKEADLESGFGVESAEPAPDSGT